MKSSGRRVDVRLMMLECGWGSCSVGDVVCQAAVRERKTNRDPRREELRRSREDGQGGGIDWPRSKLTADSDWSLTIDVTSRVLEQEIKVLSLIFQPTWFVLMECGEYVRPTPAFGFMRVENEARR